MEEHEIIEACAASALDFIDTVSLCMKEDGFADGLIEYFKEYLLSAHKTHYNTDIGEQGENLTNYLDSKGM